MTVTLAEGLIGCKAFVLRMVSILRKHRDGPSAVDRLLVGSTSKVSQTTIGPNGGDMVTSVVLAASKTEIPQRSWVFSRPSARDRPAH